MTEFQSKSATKNNTRIPKVTSAVEKSDMVPERCFQAAPGEPESGQRPRPSVDAVSACVSFWVEHASGDRATPQARNIGKHQDAPVALPEHDVAPSVSKNQPPSDADATSKDDTPKREEMLNPYYSDIEATANKYAARFQALGISFTPEILLAMAVQEMDVSRPTIAESFDHGLGIMQITPLPASNKTPKDADPAQPDPTKAGVFTLDQSVADILGWNNDYSFNWNFAHSRWRDAATNIEAGAETLLLKASDIRDYVDSPANGGQPDFWEKKLNGQQRLRAAMYAYNAGQGAASKALLAQGGNAAMLSTSAAGTIDYTAKVRGRMNYIEDHDPFRPGGLVKDENDAPPAPLGPDGRGGPSQDGPADFNEDVGELQSTLVRIGLADATAFGAEKNLYGSATTQAVTGLQHKRNVDTAGGQWLGCYGPRTRSALIDELAGIAQSPQTPNHRAVHLTQNPSVMTANVVPDHNDSPPLPTASTQSTSLPAPEPPLQYDSDNPVDAVKELQAALVHLQFLLQSDMNTGAGSFGERTLAAVQAFQATFALPEKQATDPNTYDQATHDKLVQVLSGQGRPKVPPQQGPVTPSKILPQSAGAADKDFIEQVADPKYNPNPPPGSSLPAPHKFSVNCGPTSLAMVMKALGKMPAGLSPQQEIDFARAKMRPLSTNIIYIDVGKQKNIPQLPSDPQDEFAPNGANGSDINTGLNSLDQSATWERGWDQLRAVLQAGEPVMAFGLCSREWADVQNHVGGTNYKWRDSAANPPDHVIAILGLTKDGKYIVNDPVYQGGSLEMTQDELKVFFQSADNQEPPGTPEYEDPNFAYSKTSSN